MKENMNGLCLSVVDQGGQTLPSERKINQSKPYVGKKSMVLNGAILKVLCSIQRGLRETSFYTCQSRPAVKLSLGWNYPLSFFPVPVIDCVLQEAWHGYGFVTRIDGYVGT